MKLVFLLGFAALVACVPKADERDVFSSPSRYSVCLPERGYEEHDALKAVAYLHSNVTATEGTFMANGTCIYARENSTIFSLCNGSARNRTVTQNEVRRGAEQLIKDCGADGPFNGFHVVNNLTFAAYGVFGGKNLAIPKGFNEPDLPTRSELARRASCNYDQLPYNGVPVYGCDNPPGHQIDPNTGICGDPANAQKDQCAVYCQEKITGLIGPETNGPGKYGVLAPPSPGQSITETKQYSVQAQFSLTGGLGSAHAKTMAAGAGFSMAVTETWGQSVTKTYNASGDYWSRFVYFPKLIESCGKISMMEWVQDFCQEPCDGATQSPGTCGGEIKTFDICSLTPKILEGQPDVWWAQRYSTRDEVIAPMDKQSDAYRGLCEKSGGDPDKDGVNECAAQ